jgi:hypothetical protein
MMPPRTVAGASHRHRIWKRAPTNPSRQTDAALASTRDLQIEHDLLWTASGMIIKKLGGYPRDL